MELRSDFEHQAILYIPTIVETAIITTRTIITAHTAHTASPGFSLLAAAMSSHPLSPKPGHQRTVWERGDVWPCSIVVEVLDVDQFSHGHHVLPVSCLEGDALVQGKEEAGSRESVGCCFELQGRF